MTQVPSRLWLLLPLLSLLVLLLSACALARGPQELSADAPSTLVTIDRYGEFKIGDEALQLSQLLARLQEAATGSGRQRASLRFGEALSSGDVMRTLDEVREALHSEIADGKVEIVLLQGEGESRSRTGPGL